MVRIEVGFANLLFQGGNGLPADAAAERFLQFRVDHLSEAAEFPLDRLRLLHENLEDAILRPLQVNKVVTEHVVAGL